MPDYQAAWSDAELEQTSSAFYGTGADANEADDIRFLRGVARLCRLRWDAEGKSGDPAIFVMQPIVPSQLANSAVEQPMLDNGLNSVGGGLWFVAPVVAAGVTVPLPSRDDGQMFDFVRSSGLGNEVTAVYEPRSQQPQLRFYPRGVDAPNVVKVFSIASEMVDMERIGEIVDRVHSQQLASPTMHVETGKLWADGAKWHPAERAELKIQGYLITALLSALPTCIIRPEQTQVTGRLDIEVEVPDATAPFGFSRQAIVELKVLRSFSSRGVAVRAAVNSAAVKDGVTQAAAYRIERAAARSGLFCFDMRKKFTGEACFGDVRELAREHGVELKIWHLFGTAKAMREHLVS